MGMTGFHPPEKLATVRGKDDYEGFEAEVSLSMPLRQSLAFSQDLASGDAARIRETIFEFGERVLKSWNVVDDAGNPVTADGEGMLSQDMDLAMALITGWNEALVAPPLPSSGLPEPGRTPAQAPSPPASIPMSSLTDSVSDTAVLPV